MARPFYARETYVRSSRSPSSLPPEQPSGPTPAAQPASAPAAAAPKERACNSNLAALPGVPVLDPRRVIVFLVLEKKNAYVRFYAMQSTILGGLWVVISIAFAIVYAIIGSIFGLGLLLGLIMKLTYLGFLVLTLFTAFKAFSNKEWEIPYLGKIARDRQLAGKLRRRLRSSRIAARIHHLGHRDCATAPGSPRPWLPTRSSSSQPFRGP